MDASDWPKTYFIEFLAKFYIDFMCHTHNLDNLLFISKFLQRKPNQPLWQSGRVSASWLRGPWIKSWAPQFKNIFFQQCLFFISWNYQNVYKQPLWYRGRVLASKLKGLRFKSWSSTFMKNFFSKKFKVPERCFQMILWPLSKLLAWRRLFMNFQTTLGMFWN